MRIGRTAGKVLIVAFLTAPLLHSQVEPPKPDENIPWFEEPEHPAMVQDGWHRSFPSEAPQPKKPVPAPRHNLDGSWDPGPVRGIQIFGAASKPDDGKPSHQPPYTPLGLEMLNRNKPTSGFRSVLPGETNDPIIVGDPQGLPRAELNELYVTQIVQFPEKVLILYTYGRAWRVIWTDGRDFPKDPEPRWFGYSIGKWVDDTTLLVETRGVDDRTWVDVSGRPHSADMVFKEWFHRVDQNHMELSIQIDDPKVYSRPWVALYKLPFDLRPPDFDIREMIFAPSDDAEYEKYLAAPVSKDVK